MMQKIKQILSSLLIPTTIQSPFTKDLSEEVVIITGASQGIGSAIAKTLFSEGAKLVLIARDKKKLVNEHKEMLEKPVLFVEADITKEKDIEGAVKETLAKFGKITVVINNAGVFLDKELHRVTEGEFSTIVDTNIKGVVFITKAVLKHFKKQKSGLVVNIGSKISHNSNVASKKTLYAMTKYAVEGFSIALNQEVKKYGIRVTCLMPGTVNTFVSFKSKQFLVPQNIGFLISTIIKMKDITFDHILFQSLHQNL